MGKKTNKILATRPQIAALPMRADAGGRLQVLLVTSRETCRWIVPKGWPEKGMKDCDAAAKEAREEAGVLGPVSRQPIGFYDYWKRLDDRFQHCHVDVYALNVTDQLLNWREKGQRQQAWFSPQAAADAVDEPGLKELLAGLGKDAVAQAAE